jgi:hypothetical protein
MGVPERTARLWAGTPEFKRSVAEIRRQVVSQTVGILTRASIKATARLVKLTDSDDDEVSLKACNSLLDKLMAVQSHLELESRIARLEENAAGQPAHRYGVTS